ncbi:hypothetical protein GCM10010319_28710 [Streptomyces blastmyceticus]|uniref:Uncharacterized protein n=1 Tax=Streptomyces blastmyceticus TaxID=68180 RepID=A0ABN0WYD2_9ACTN
MQLHPTRKGPAGNGSPSRATRGAARGPLRREHKKIALDPAESSAIDDSPKSVGKEPVGAGPPVV